MTRESRQERLALGIRVGSKGCEQKEKRGKFTGCGVLLGHRGKVWRGGEAVNFQNKKGRIEI